MTKFLNQTDVSTEAGLFRAGEQRWLTFEENQVPQLLLSPASWHHLAATNFDLVDQAQDVGKSQLRCILTVNKGTLQQRIATAKMSATVGMGPGFSSSQCFASDSAVLRSESSGGNGALIVFNNIGQLGDQFVARDVRITKNGKIFLDVHVLEVGAVSAGTHPPEPGEGGTGPLKEPVELPDGRMRIVTGFGDFFEAVERAIPKNQSVTANLLVAINAQGQVRDVAVTGGPPEFGKVVAKAIHKLTYAPFIVAGVPVEVSLQDEETFGSTTTVTVIRR